MKWMMVGLLDYTTGEFQNSLSSWGVLMPTDSRYTASLKLHKELFSLESHQAPSENELVLIYSLDTPNNTKKRVIVKLLFVPNTRQLAEVEVEGISAAVEEVVGMHIQANDVSGLIAALLALARAEA